MKPHQKGQAITEYALILSMVAIATGAALTTMSFQLDQEFTNMSQSVSSFGQMVSTTGTRGDEVRSRERTREERLPPNEENTGEFHR